MTKLVPSQVDFASESIAALLNLKKKVLHFPQHLEQGLLQQYLDQEFLYIKQVAHDSSNVYKAIADGLYFSQSRHTEVSNTYARCLQENSDVFELSNLVFMVASTNCTEYSKRVTLCKCTVPEIFYLTSEGLMLHTIHPQEKNVGTDSISLFMGPDGMYDTLHGKAFIKSAGICQSILFEVLEGNSKKKAPVYQNVEYIRWKECKETQRIPMGYLCEEGGREKSRSPRKRAPSDTSVSTPALIKQIRSYFSPSPITKKTISDGFMAAADEVVGDHGNIITRPNSEDIKTGNNSIPIYPHVMPQYEAVPYFPAQYYPHMPMPPTPLSYDYSGYEQSHGYFYGQIKFFDEVQNYGFFVMYHDGSDLFVHYDDFLKAGITKEMIRNAKQEGTQFVFRCMKYYGKYDMSYKAVDIQFADCYYSEGPYFIQ